MDQLSAQYVLMVSGHHNQLHNASATINVVQQLQAVIERSSAPRKNFLIDTTTPHGDAVITEASAMKPGIGWITLQVTEGIRKGVHEWSIKIENQGETTDGSGLMLGIVPKSFSKFDSFISQGGGWCLSRAGKFYGHWRRHESSPSATITFGTGDRVVFTLDYDNARMTVRVGDKAVVGEISNLTSEVFPALSLHYRHQHVRFEYHVTHDRSAKQRDWVERGVLPTAATVLPLGLTELERLPLDSYLFSSAFSEHPPPLRDGPSLLQDKKQHHFSGTGTADGAGAGCDAQTSGTDEDYDDVSSTSSFSGSGSFSDAAGGARLGDSLSEGEGTRVDSTLRPGDATVVAFGGPRATRRRRCGSADEDEGGMSYASLEAFRARLTVLLNAFAAVRRYTEVSPATRGKFLSPSVTAEYLRKRFYESLHGSMRGAGSNSGAPMYDATLNCGAVMVLHMFAKVASSVDNPLALPLVKSLTDYLLSLPLFSLAETNPAASGVGGAGGLGNFGGSSSLSPEVVQLAVDNIFSLVEASLDAHATASSSSSPVAPSALCSALVELATLLALQRGVVHETLRACRALLRCPKGLLSRPFMEWLQRNANALRPRRELPDLGKGLKAACEDMDHFVPTALNAATAKTQILSVAFGGDSEGACHVFVHTVDGVSRWVERMGRYEEAQHTRKPDACCAGATRSSMALTLTHMFLLTDRMLAEGVAVVVYTTALELHRVFALHEMDPSWPRESRANAQLTSGPEDQIILVYECHDQPAVHVANGAAAAAATSSAVLSAGNSIARAATRGKAVGVQAQGYLFPSFPRLSWTTTLKAPTTAFDFSLTHCLALRKPCLVDLGPPDAYLQLPAGHVTVEMWVTLLDKEDATTLYQHGDKSTTGEVFLETARLEGAYCIRGGYRHDARGACVVSAPLPPTAETHFFHIALVFDGRWHLFFDGEEVACNRQGPHVSLDAPKQRWTLCNNCTCLLAGLRVWLLGRSAREVGRDYKRMLAGDEPGLACQMLFNEYSGNVAFNYVASTRSRHAICNGSFTHTPCDNHPWRSFGSGHPGILGGALGVGGDDVDSTTHSSSPSSANALRGELIPPRSAIHEWADLSLTRCFCYQGQLVLTTQVSDAAPYALPSGRVSVFFDMHSGASCSAFFYLTSKSPALGFMGIDAAWNRVYELFELGGDAVPSSSTEGTTGGPEVRVLCVARVPLERDGVGSDAILGVPAAPAGASTTASPLSPPVVPIGPPPMSGSSARSSVGGGTTTTTTGSGLPPLRPSTEPSVAHPPYGGGGFSSAFLPLSPTTLATDASSPSWGYGNLSSWLLQLLSQYAAAEPAQEMAQLFSPLADDVGRRCSAEVRATLHEHFRVVKGANARRVVTLASPASKDVIACALQILLRLIRRARAFGLHPASVGLNVFEDAPSSSEDINRLLRELSVSTSRRRSTSNSPLTASSTFVMASQQPSGGSATGIKGASTNAPTQPAAASSVSGGSTAAGESEMSASESDLPSAGTLIGLLGDVINEAGKTLPVSLGVLARTVIVEGIDLFIPQVRSRARLLREVLAVAASATATTAGAHPTTAAAAALVDRIPALDALVDGTVESLSTVLAAAPLLAPGEQSGCHQTGVVGGHANYGRQPSSSALRTTQGNSSGTGANVLRLIDDDTAAEVKKADDEGRPDACELCAESGTAEAEEDALRETRGTLRVLIEESLTQLRTHFASRLTPVAKGTTVVNGAGSPSGSSQTHSLSQPPLLPSSYRSSPNPVPAASARVGSVDAVAPSGASPSPATAAARVRGVRAASLVDAISALQLLLLSTCQGLPVEQLMNSAATSQQVLNVFAVPKPCPEHRRCIKAYYSGVFKATREGLDILLRANQRACDARQASEDASVIANSFLAVPLHTALMSIPLVVSMDDAPWFLRELEHLLPVCDAARRMPCTTDTTAKPAGKASASATGNSATAPHEGSPPLRRKAATTPLHVLFDAVLLSASWVATCMSRASAAHSAPKTIAALTDANVATSHMVPGTIATDGAMRSDVESPAQGAGPNVIPAKNPDTTARAEAEQCADSIFLAAGVNLNALPAVTAAAAAAAATAGDIVPGASFTETKAASCASSVSSPNARRSSLLAILTSARKEHWFSLQKRSDALGARVTEDVAHVITLASAAALHLSNESEKNFEAAMPQTLRRLLPLRNDLLERRTKLGKPAFASLLGDMTKRCLLLLCAMNPLEDLRVDGDVLVRPLLETHPRLQDSGSDQAASPKAQWRQAISAVRRALHLRTATAVANTSLNLTHAIAFVSRCVQSTVTTAAVLQEVLESREKLAQVRLQGLEQLLMLMRKEPSCTESVAQFLSTQEDAPGMVAGMGVATAGAELPTMGSPSRSSAATLTMRGKKASHVEAGINGCSTATRHGLRTAMYAILHWLTTYQRRRSRLTQKMGMRHGSRSHREATDRLPYLCAFLYRTWWPRDLTVLRHLGLVPELFGAHCSLFAESRQGGTGPRRPTVLSAVEGQHRTEALGFQQRLALSRGAGSGGSTAPGASALVGSGATAAAVSARDGPSTGDAMLEELHLVPTRREYAKRTALECLKQLGLQCAAALSSVSENGSTTAPSASLDSLAASHFLNDLVVVIHRELMVCLEYATFTASRPLTEWAGEVIALRDQVRVLGSLLATVFRALSSSVNFRDDLARSVVACARTLYRLLASDVLIPAGERAMPGRCDKQGMAALDDLAVPFSPLIPQTTGSAGSGASSALPASGTAATSPSSASSLQHVSRGASYLLLVGMMLAHCPPATANVAFDTPEMAAMCKQYCAWDPTTREGAALGALFAMTVDSVQASGLNAISRAGLTALRSLLCSRPRWAAQLHVLAPQFQADLRRTARDGEEGALLAFKTYVWSAVLGGCALLVPAAGMRVRVRGDEREGNGSNAGTHDAFVVDMPVPSHATTSVGPNAPPAGTPEAALLESTKRAAEQVVVLPTSTTITEEMNWEETATGGFLRTDRANRSELVSPVLTEKELRVQRDNLFLPPLTDALGHAKPAYADLAEAFVVPALRHYLVELPDKSMRELHAVEVAALASFLHLALSLVRESPASCAALLEGETLLAITRFANRAVAHHPLPMVFLKEFAAVALSSACDALAFTAATAPPPMTSSGGKDTSTSAHPSPSGSDDALGGQNGAPLERLSASAKKPVSSALAPQEMEGSSQPARGEALAPGPFLFLGAAQTTACTSGASGESAVSTRVTSQSSPVVGSTDRTTSGSPHPPFHASLRARRPGTGSAMSPISRALGPPAAGAGMSPLVAGLPSLFNATRDADINSYIGGVLSRLTAPQGTSRSGAGDAASRVGPGASTAAVSSLSGLGAAAAPGVFPAPSSLSPMTKGLYFYMAPASGVPLCGTGSPLSTESSNSPVLPAYLTITPRDACDALRDRVSKPSAPSLPLWNDGITLEVAFLLCDRVFPQLGEDYVVPARETVGGLVGGRPAVNFSFFSLYVRPRRVSAGRAGAPEHPPSSVLFRLLHVCIEGDAFVCRLTLPDAAVKPVECRMPVLMNNWDHTMHLAVVLDNSTMVLNKNGETASAAVPPNVAAAVAEMLSHGEADTDAAWSVDRLIVGSHDLTSDLADKPLGVPSLEECAIAILTGVRMWGSAQTRSALRANAELVQRDVELPPFDPSEHSCFFNFHQSGGGAMCSVDGSFAATLAGHVRWGSCQFRYPPDFMDPPDKINVGSLRQSPGGGSDCPAAMLPRSEMEAFFAALDSKTALRVGSELLWTLVARLARVVVATAMQGCLSEDYRLHHDAAPSSLPKDTTRPEGRHGVRAAEACLPSGFPFNPFLLVDEKAGYVARQACNLFRFSDVGFLSAQSATLLREFMQYTARYIAAFQVADKNATSEDGRSTRTLQTFARETRETIEACFSDDHEYFMIEIAPHSSNLSAASAGLRAGLTTSTSQANPPVMPLALLNGGTGALYGSPCMRLCESITVFKDRALKNAMDKAPDSRMNWGPCSIQGPAAQWVYVKIALPSRSITAALPSDMMLCGVTVKSLQPAMARIVFGAVAETFRNDLHTQDKEAAVGHFLDAAFLARLVQSTDSRAGFEVRAHAVYVAAALLDLWRAFPHLKRYDQTPLNAVLAHVNAALMGLLQRDRHGFEKCGEVSPTLGTYNCFFQGLFELLVSAVRLEEAWYQHPQPLRIRARWRRLTELWHASTRFVPVVPPTTLAAATTSPVSTAGTRRMSLASSSTVLAESAATLPSVVATTQPPSSSKDGASRPPPLSVACAAHGGDTGCTAGTASAPARVPVTPPRAFGSISTNMDGALPPIEMHPLWPPQLATGAQAGGANAGRVNVKGNGEWLLRCDRGSITARSTIGYTQGRFYFEVKLPERPLGNANCNALIVGLVTARSRIGETGEAIGQDGESWGYDGAQLCRVHQGHRTELSPRTHWKPGEVLGFLMDITEGRFALLHQEQEIKGFEKLRPASARSAEAEAAAEVTYFPAVTLMAGCTCEVNFGAAPFYYGMPLFFLPANPQHFCGAQATSLWSLLVAVEWGRMCRRGDGAGATRAALEARRNGAGAASSDSPSSSSSKPSPSLHTDPAFGILQRHIHQSCDGRCGPVANVDFLTSTSRLREGIDELQTDELPCVVRGGVAVRRGRWYYEVMLRMTSASTTTALEGTVTVGWTVVDVDGEWSAGAVATGSGGLTVLPGKALGDDEYSWVLEGRRMIAKHNKHQISLGRHAWQDGDVVGCLLDCDAGTMRFTINGQLQREVHDTDGDGVLFRHVDTMGGAGLSPAIAVDAKMSVVFLWNQEDLKYPPIDILTHEDAQQTTARRTGAAGGNTSTGRSPYRALGASNVFTDAVVEYFMGTTPEGEDCCTSREFHRMHRGTGPSSPQALETPTPATLQVSLPVLEKVLRYVSRTTDLNPFRLPAYCLYPLLGLKSMPPATVTPRRTSSGVDKAPGARQRRSSRRTSTSGSAMEKNNPGSQETDASFPTATMLGLTVEQLRAALDQLSALTAAAEKLFRFGQDGRIPFALEEVHHSTPPSALHDALLSLRRYCLPYLGLRALRRFLVATDGPSESLKLIVNRRRALAAMHNVPGTPPAQRMHDSLFGQIYSLLAGRNPTLFCTDKKLWTVSFFGEGADDVGGPYRESLSQMCAELMNTEGLLPLFITSPNQVADVGESRDVLVVSPLPGPPVLLDMYRFLGRLLGGCLRGAEPLSLYLPSVVWKMLVDDLPDGHDLARVDQATVNALEYVEKLGDEAGGSSGIPAEEADEMLASLCPEGFTAQDDGGVTHELVCDGRDIPVTTRNAGAYAQHAMRLKLFLAARPRLLALREGFHQVVPLCSVTALKWFELEELVCGQRDYDPDALLDAARYEDLDADDTRVLFLRQALKDFTRHQRGMFMRFVSGRERLPPGMRLKIMADKTGDAADNDRAYDLAPQPPQDDPSSSFVRGHGGPGLRLTPQALALHRSGEGDSGAPTRSPADARLPHASTCFYWLSLPNYSSLAVMKERLLFAIEQCIDIDADFRVHDEDVAQQVGEPQLARVTNGDEDDNFESFAHLR